MADSDSTDLDQTSDEVINGTQKCGYVAIVGRPNVGKSTLLNFLLGQKVSITSRKPQTTRHNLLGIKTQGDVQLIYVDTPGIHTDQKKAINRYMNKTATTAAAAVDVVVLVVDRMKWTEADEHIATLLKQGGLPVVVAINKVDIVDNKKQLLPYAMELAKKVGASGILPISALHGDKLVELEQEILRFIPDSIHFFPQDQITDRTSRFLAAELVREKITRQLGDEIPYETTVEIEEFKEEQQVLHISALILVQREGQKRVVIGKAGSRLKKIGQEARLDMEQLFDSKVMLNLWVKVKAGWSDDERALKSLGYTDE